jgi:hypothetical protein
MATAIISIVTVLKPKIGGWHKTHEMRWNLRLLERLRTSKNSTLVRPMMMAMVMVRIRAAAMRTRARTKTTRATRMLITSTGTPKIDLLIAILFLIHFHVLLPEENTNYEG